MPVRLLLWGTWIPTDMRGQSSKEHSGWKVESVGGDLAHGRLGWRWVTSLLGTVIVCVG